MFNISSIYLVKVKIFNFSESENDIFHGTEEVFIYFAKLSVVQVQINVVYIVQCSIVHHGHSHSIEVLHSRMFCLLLRVFLSKLIPRPWFGLVRRTNEIQQCNEGYGMSAKSLRGERPHNHRAKYIYPLLCSCLLPCFLLPEN